MHVERRSLVIARQASYVPSDLGFEKRCDFEVGQFCSQSAPKAAVVACHGTVVQVDFAERVEYLFLEDVYIAPHFFVSTEIQMLEPR